MKLILWGGLLTGLLITGCSSQLTTDYAPLQAALEDRRLAADTDFDMPAEQHQQQIDSLLQNSLSAEDARRLALLNSPSLRAELATLGVAAADLRQAGLISNPVLGVAALRPEGGGRWQLDLGLSQSLLQVMTRSLRRDLAEADYQQQLLTVSERTTDYLLAVEESYYKALAAEHQLQVYALLQHTASTRRLMAERFYAAGNIPEQQLLQQQLLASEMERQQQAAQATTIAARSQLAQLLGVSDADRVILPQRLLEPPDETLDRGALNALALEQRLDRALLQAELNRVQQQRTLFVGQRGLQQLDAGVAFERESDGGRKLGPTLDIELPLFDRGHARLAAIDARLQQRQAQLEALDITINNEVVAALSALTQLRQQLAQLQGVEIPNYQRLVELKLEQYNYMLAGVFELIDAREREYRAHLEYSELLQDFWQARAQLAVVTGGGLPDFPVRPAALPDSSDAIHEHEAPASSAPEEQPQHRHEKQPGEPPTDNATRHQHH